MTDEKIINDSIFGSIKLSTLASRIIETKEFQRLNGVKQLGLTYLVFPGANHTRFEHSIGTYYLSEQLSRKLHFSDEEIEEISISGLLHDIGHPPYSHSMEEAMIKKYRIDHLQATIKIINGEINDNISKILGNDILEEVIKILQGRSGVKSKIISGHGDMDQLDYLSRDSKYTGVALGAVDITRILNTMMVKDNELCMDEKGLPAMEGLMIARMLMYKSVYRHRIALIGSALLNKALDSMEIEFKELIEMNDADFISEIKKSIPWIYESIKYRKFPKGFILKIDQKQYYKILEDLGDQIMASRFFSSPYKSQYLKVFTKKGLVDLNKISTIMTFLESELYDEAIIVFKREDENNIRKYLHDINIEPI